MAKYWPKIADCNLSHLSSAHR